MNQVVWIIDGSVPNGIRECEVIRHENGEYVLQYIQHGVTLSVLRSEKDVFLDKDQAIAMLHSFKVKSPKV